MAVLSDRIKCLSGVTVIGLTLGSVTDVGSNPRLSGHAAEGSDCSTPISRIPAGWLWIPTQVTDSAPGAYHDTVSGAFVRYDGLRRDSPLLRSARAKRPFRISARVGGIPYELEVIPDVRAKLIEDGRRRWGPEFPDNTTTADTLPSQGARRLKLTFLVREAEWEFVSDVYSKSQEKRVRQLLLGSTGIVCEHLVARQAQGWSGLDAPTCSALSPGTTAEQVLQIPNAIPGSASPLGKTGFRLAYDGQDDSVELHFGQDQTLVAKVPEE